MGKLIAYIYRVYSIIISNTILAFRDIFILEKHYYSNYLYAAFKHALKNNPELLFPIINSRFLKEKIHKYYKNNNYFYLIINYYKYINIMLSYPKAKPKASPKIL